MRITYRQLAQLIARMTPQQQHTDVTIEMTDEHYSMCYPAQLRTAGEDHDGGLDEDHPVLFVLFDAEKHERTHHLEELAKIANIPLES